MPKIAHASSHAADCTCPLHVETSKHVRRAQRFAGRLLAEGYTPSATDEEMRAAFAGCVRPAPSDLYSLIRLEAVRLEAERVGLVAPRSARTFAQWQGDGWQEVTLP